MKDVKTLREKLDQKLEAGELNREEYEELVGRLEHLDLMSTTVKENQTKSRILAVGFTKIDTQEVEGPIKVSGKLVTTGPLTCNTMSVSGSAKISGDLKVAESTKVSGRLNVEGAAKFGGPVKISGKLDANENIYGTDYMKIAGKAFTEGDFVLGGDLKVAGKVTCNAVRSTAAVKLAGTMKINDSVISREFRSTGGKSNIGGNLTSDLVEIAKDYRTDYNISSLEEEASELDSIPALGTFISKMVTSFIPQMVSRKQGTPGQFGVIGSIIGDELDISFTEVGQDVVGKSVIIGPNVEINGTIKYVDNLEVTTDSEYDLIQISQEEFNQLKSN